MEYGYVAVEGPHDVELVGRLLKPYGFRRVQSLEKLDRFWHPLVPRAFPIKDDLLRRVPVPTFFENESHAIAVNAAGGHGDRLVRTVEESLFQVPALQGTLSGIGVILDSDERPPETVFEVIRNGLTELGLDVPARAGDVSNSSPRCGVFVLPDNTSTGLLEDILLECGSAVYPTLHRGAKDFVDGIDMNSPAFADDDKGQFQQPSGRKKALLGCMAAVLRPGKALQVSIQDNRWVGEETFGLPRVQALKDFMASLLQLT